MVYVAEDALQVERVLASLFASNELGGCSMGTIRERFKIVEAKRLDVDTIAQVRAAYEALAVQNTGPVGTFSAQPVIVFDTAAATIHLENENDNAEVSRAVATIKQSFSGMPVLIVAHLAKALKRAEVGNLSARGAGAWEADAHQVCYLTHYDDAEPDLRWLEIKSAKHRFCALGEGIKFRLVRNTYAGRDILNNPKDISVVHGSPEIPADGAALMLTIGQGSTAGEILSNYSGLSGVTAAEHLLAEKLVAVRGGIAARNNKESINRFNAAVSASILAAEDAKRLLIEPWSDGPNVADVASMMRKRKNEEAIALILAIVETL